MQSASCVSVKCEPTIFELRAATMVIYELWATIQPVCELQAVINIRLWVGSLISLHYIKSALSIYIISSLHVKQSKSNKVIWYIIQYCDLSGNELEKYAIIYPNIEINTEAPVHRY